MKEDPIRTTIEEFGSRLTLPIARKALGALEGEHGSDRYGHGYDYLDLRQYEPGDEAQLIDWKASARANRPIIVNKQRDVTSTVWLVIDSSEQMLGSAESGEPMIDVAANALRMFALLSLKRSDNISLVLADSQAITRLPFSGGYPKFNHLLDESLAGLKPAPRDLTSLLRYAEGISSKNSLIVIASDDTAMDKVHEKAIATVSENHPLIFISVTPMNPFSPAHHGIVDAGTGRTMPSFLQDDEVAQDIAARADVIASAFDKSLARHGDTLLRAGSSKDMLTNFIHLVSTRLHGARPQKESLLPDLQKGGAR